MKRSFRISALLAIALMLTFPLMAQLPKEYEPLDFDQDGVMDIEEVLAVIDGFISGENEYSAVFIHDLIDYFFEQEA